MRRFYTFIALLICIAAPVAAQTRTDLRPVPDVKPPVMVPLDESFEPQVTITKRDSATFEEYRLNGRLYQIKVTPENGIPYTLIDQRGDGTFSVMDTQSNPAPSIPMWVIGTF